jgi:preprotein translocase subunit SecD
MNIKFIFLLPLFIYTNKTFAQRRSDLICASDTAKIKIESGLYVLQPLATETNGLRVRNIGKYYCIEKDKKMRLTNIDSLSIVYNKYSKAYDLNFHFNKKGTKQLASFSMNYIGQDAGFFINNKLISAGKIAGSIDKGNMTLEGNFSEGELITIKKEIEEEIRK